MPFGPGGRLIPVFPLRALARGPCRFLAIGVILVASAAAWAQETAGTATDPAAPPPPAPQADAAPSTETATAPAVGEPAAAAEAPPAQPSAAAAEIEKT